MLATSEKPRYARTTGLKWQQHAGIAAQQPVRARHPTSGAGVEDITLIKRTPSQWDCQWTGQHKGSRSALDKRKRSAQCGRPKRNSCVRPSVTKRGGTAPLPRFASSSTSRHRLARHVMSIAHSRGYAKVRRSPIRLSRTNTHTRVAREISTIRSCLPASSSIRRPEA